MTNPTRQEIIEAYREIDMLLGHYDDRNPGRVPECRAIIEKALPPRPRPTMAEIEWDDDVHYLAEAETPDLVGKVVMLRKTESGLIEFTMTTCTPLTKGCTWPEKLTPTGKRYTLTEVQE